MSPGVLDSETGPPHLVVPRELVNEELRLAVARSLDAELIHSVTKRVWMKIQDLSRALWTINHSTGMLKGGEHVVSFHFVQCEERLWRLEVCLPIFWSIRLRSIHPFRLSGDRHQITIQPERRVRRDDHRVVSASGGFAACLAQAARVWSARSEDSGVWSLTLLLVAAVTGLYRIISLPIFAQDSHLMMVGLVELVILAAAAALVAPDAIRSQGALPAPPAYRQLG